MDQKAPSDYPISDPAHQAAHSQSSASRFDDHLLDDTPLIYRCTHIGLSVFVSVKMIIYT